MVSVLLIGVITFTGRLVNNKGVKELMLAFEKVAAKHNDAKLLIVGGQLHSLIMLRMITVMTLNL